jgi:hypothetical protein
MADNKLLGCWGFIVGALVTVVVGWMTFELFIAILAGLRLDGLAVFADTLLWHAAGELLVVGLTILGIYVWVFRGPGLARFVARTRMAFWIGAVLNLAALLGTWGSRWSTWTLILAVLGFLVPEILARLSPPPEPAPTP